MLREIKNQFNFLWIFSYIFRNFLKPNKFQELSKNFKELLVLDVIIGNTVLLSKYSL